MQVLTQANEKYIGDALLQKTYTVDFLTKKRVSNNGIVPQYYVENSHSGEERYEGNSDELHQEPAGVNWGADGILRGALGQTGRPYQSRKRENSNRCAPRGNRNYCIV